VIFGKPENYFSGLSYRKFKSEAASKAGTNNWSLQVSELVLNDVKKVAFKSNPIAIFDSTTEYIWGSADNINAITDSFDAFNEPCNEDKSTKLIKCYCQFDSDIDKFPNLNFRFKGQTIDEAPF